MNESITRPRNGKLGRLRGYNQFPLHYENITVMTADLQRIKNMGFTSVWVNPLFEPCQSTEWVEKEIARGQEGTNPNSKDKKLHSEIGSPYATRSFAINSKLSAHRGKEFAEEERKLLDYADIRRYTDTARSLNLTPIYDFVMRHMAVDNPLVQEKPHWFKRHTNGNFVFFGRDEYYHTTRQSWDDVLEFNYDDPAVRREIIEQYLKPMADIVIRDFGFEGLRIDAAGKIPREVFAEIIPYIDKRCEEQHKKPAAIMGETLGQNVDEFQHLGGYMDYVYNSVYFEPFTKDFWNRDETGFSKAKGVLQNQVSPTIGFAGNHDVVRLADYYVNKNHIRGDLLRQVITAGVVNSEVPLNKVLNIFVSLNDKGAFTRDQLRTIVQIAADQGVVTPSEAPELFVEIHEKGKLKQQQIKAWVNECPPATVKQGRTVFEALMDIMFTVVRQEKAKESYEIRTHNESKSKKLVSENDFIKLIPGQLDKTRLCRLMREAFCFTAFASDGGWFFSLGDEWGVTKRTNVFTASPEDLNQRAYPNIDFSGFIRSINAIIGKLPSPSNPEWVQRCYLNDPAKDKLFASFLIHQGESFSQPCHLVIANVSDEKQVVDYETFMEIKDANGRNNCPGKDKFPGFVYLCGDVALTPHLGTALESKGVKILTSNGQQDQNISTKSRRISLPIVH